MKNKRVFLIVLDSLGVGEAPDAAEFGDTGANTLKSLSASPEFNIPNLMRLGVGNIAGLDFLGRVASPSAAVGRLAEKSRGKDTTIGHWEIAGIVSDKPMPTYPDGFPEGIIEQFVKKTGRGVLCNRPYSGTQAILDYGREHILTGRLIVYTSADSVFQIAAHEEVVPVEQLYEYCRVAREIMTGEHAVGRIIARPFEGEYPNYTRTTRRQDFSLAPPRMTILDALREAGYDTIAVGKIKDIFAGRGISEHYPSRSNADGMRIIEGISERQEWRGLCFANLVDFDSSYGHRRDIDGYARALAEFDRLLGGFLPGMREDDILMITADHGCDPGFTKTTDHTREYVPLIVCGSSIRPVNLGTRGSFADIAATLAWWFGVGLETPGGSFASEVDR